jgi:hypothetical protein
VALLVAVALAAAVPAVQAAIPESQRRMLALGAMLGDDRTEVIAWATSGSVSLLRVDGVKDERKPQGWIGDYDVLERRSLTIAQIDQLRRLLLDPGTYSGTDIRRPERPTGYGQGSGKLCGGFRPAVAITLTDDEARTLDVLVCFACDEIRLVPVITEADRTNSMKPADPLAAKQAAVRSKPPVTRDLSGRAVLQLLNDSLKHFPKEAALQWQRERRTKRDR